ncbi:cytochrome P450 [Phytohabitans houttuyneae]|uniref:Cytochrome P450 n=1 Tax=Phytohabitans houttuyneae TaxID=1076126 RepID=A0A6V8K8R8_9ACTN|nr:cytochrome P450 [Phytohabitans houttuyneae]GFJ78529.1 cytochrome P450 [Phytohabitans houttuyneae]
MELRPFSGTYLTDPAAIWRDLLDGPERVHYADDLGLWLITKHADVRNALGDSEAFSNALTLLPIYEMCPEALAIVMEIDAPPTTAAADAPTHTRTRRALRATFPNTSARVNEQYGAIVRRRVDELVSRLVARRGTVVDLVSEFAAELPLLVIVDLLGVPPEDVPAIKSWSDGQIALIWGQPEPEEQVRLARGLLDFWRYCQKMVTLRAQEGGGGEDFISKALRYRAGDDEILTENEVASFAFNLLVAGHETTSGLIAHGLDNALSVPTRWERLVENPAGVPAFVEETLRFGPAIDGWLRLTTRDVTFGETTIPAGSRCLLLLGAANRDAATFSHPDVFDPNRADVRDHLAFGYGPHFCIGAALARLEAQVALTELTAAVPGLRLAPEHITSFKPNVGFRAHNALPVFVETFAQIDDRTPRAA